MPVLIIEVIYNFIFLMCISDHIEISNKFVISVMGNNRNFLVRPPDLVWVEGYFKVEWGYLLMLISQIFQCDAEFEFFEG